MPKVTFLILFYFISSTSYAIRPNNHYDRTPVDLGIAYDSLNLSTVDHYRLTAWLCHPSKQKATKTIVLVSQDAGNMSNNLDIVKAMVDALPANVLMFDYRGFGTSDHILFDTRYDCRGYSLKVGEDFDTDYIALPQFDIDLSAAIDALTEQGDSISNIILYGRSMGASLALAYASSPYLKVFGGVIAESPYVTQAGLKRFYTKEYARIGSKRKVKIIADKRLEPLAGAKTLRCPVLLIHGQLEQPISNDELCSLYQAVGSKRKTLWIVENADHMQVPFVQTGAFLSQVYSLVTAQ
jgi:pimeloyl-ACP methyl ester carboxylesterase